MSIIFQQIWEKQNLPESGFSAYTNVGFTTKYFGR